MAEKQFGKTDNSKWDPPQLFVEYLPLPDGHKRVFFGILKRLLQEPHTLEDGMWHEKVNNGIVFKLIYGRKVCKVISESKRNTSDTAVATLDIYLQWRGDYIEELSLKNLQTVQNELKYLGVQDERTHACFSVAKHRFVQEPRDVQLNSTLSIFGEINLTFGQQGRKIITVMYEEKESTAVYYIQ